MYDRIKEVIEKEILEAKKETLSWEHLSKYSELNGTDGCHEINSQMNAEDSITEYQKILNFVERCEDDWHWLIGNYKESGVGKSNWGKENYPNTDRPLYWSRDKKNFKDIPIEEFKK